MPVTVTAIRQTQPLGGGAIIGDAKSGFQTGDHSGWIKLDGRLKTSLTLTQQTNATNLGIGLNLSDATQRDFRQGALFTQIGSSTITQANLPNVNLTSSAVSAGTPSGNITIITHSTDAGGFDPLPFSGIGNLQQTDRTPENSQTLGVGIGGSFVGIALANHSHSVPLGGSGTAYIPLSIGVNQFIYLGV
jgi:hypothetical protein